MVACFWLTSRCIRSPVQFLLLYSNDCLLCTGAWLRCGRLQQHHVLTLCHSADISLCRTPLNPVLQ
jgi:hypothetical protein